MAWTDLAVETDVQGGDWNQLLYSSEALPSNARQLRIRWQNIEGESWSPQIGRLDLGWIPSGEE